MKISYTSAFLYYYRQLLNHFTYDKIKIINDERIDVNAIIDLKKLLLDKEATTRFERALLRGRCDILFDQVYARNGSIPTIDGRKR